MPELAQLLVMLAAFVIYLILSGWSRHSKHEHKPPKQWWGRGR